MDLKVEHLEDHTAQLTVVVDESIAEDARRKAAKRVGKDLRIPGFRKGKVPYNVILGYLGKAGLNQEALEELGNEVYQQALEESDIEPAAPGEISDVNLEDDIVITFLVPKRPDVELGDYRSLRVDFEIDDVTDEDVEVQMAIARENLALGEQVDRPAEIGDRVIISVRGIMADDDEEEEADDVDENEEFEDEDDNIEDDIPDPEDIYIDEQQMPYVLLENYPRREIVPGFSEELVGMSAQDEKQFTLTFPDDEKDEDLAGRSVDFTVTVTEVQALILPVEDDFMAELASDGELKNLDELRNRVQEQLIEAHENRARNRYSDQVLDMLVENAQITYPDAAVEQYVDEIVDEMNDYMMRQAGIRLEDYLKYSATTMEELRDQNRERAFNRMSRSLVLTALAEAEKLEVTDEELEAHIEEQVSDYGGEQADLLRTMLQGEGYRERIALNLLTEKTVDRLIAIAKGEAPPQEEPADEDEATLEDTE